MRILLVEDDEALILVLRRHLEKHHYVVDVVKNGEAGWRYGSTFDYGLIMLDVALPELDGIRLCQRLRAEGCTTPILLLTSAATSAVKIGGLDAGADDYVVKPFDLEELSARIRALLRRSKSNLLPILSWENIVLNPSTCEVTYNAQPLTLTAKEYELLELLLRDSQHVFSTDEILDNLWSSEEFPAEATVRSHIRRLRHKLTAAGAPDLIATVHGRGYYLRSPATGTTEAAISTEAPGHKEVSPDSQTPLLLVVDADPEFTRSLIEEAANRKIRTAIAPTAAAAQAWLVPPIASAVDVVLLRIVASDIPDAAEFRQRQSLLQTLIQQPTPALLAIGPQKWCAAPHCPSQRQRFLEPTVAMEHLLTVIHELLQTQRRMP
jgi:DNA-binding response OmpR family regulator